MLKLSPTKINTYLNCPFKYKCDCDPELRDKYRKDTPPLVFGSLVHSCLEEFYKNVNKEERSVEKLRELFEKKFKDRWEQKYKNVFSSKQEIVTYIEKAKDIFENFAESEFFEKEPIMVEEYPKYSLKDNLEIRGKFDRVDQEDGKVTIIDYKTGKFRKNRISTFQIDFYELLLDRAYPDYEIKEKILYYLSQNKVLRYKADQEKLPKIEEKIVKVAETIKKDREFNPNPNPLCPYCNYREICPAFKNEKD